MQNQSPSVSVVITTYNRGTVVANAVESVLSQTYNNYEIIIVDDGSVDDTATRMRPYLGRIRYHHQQNQGVSAARNIGIKLAEGDWIAFLDSDDTWDQRKLELQLAALAKMDEEVGACFTNCLLAGNPCRTLTTFQEAGFQPVGEIGTLEEPTRWVLARYPILLVVSLLVQRSLVLESEGFDNRMIEGEDADLLFRLSLKTKFCFVNKALVNIDIVPDRTDRLSHLYNIGDDRALCSREIMFKKWLQLLDGRCDVALRDQVGDLLIHNYYLWLKKHIIHSEWSKVPPLVRKIRCCELGYSKYVKLLRTLYASGMRKLEATHRT